MTWQTPGPSRRVRSRRAIQYSRRHFVPHAPGTRFLDASSTGEFATDAEMELELDRTASSVKNMTFIALKTTRPDRAEAGASRRAPAPRDPRKPDQPAGMSIPRT